MSQRSNYQKLDNTIDHLYVNMNDITNISNNIQNLINDNLKEYNNIKLKNLVNQLNQLTNKNTADIIDLINKINQLPDTSDRNQIIAKFLQNVIIYLYKFKNILLSQANKLDSIQQNKRKQNLTPSFLTHAPKLNGLPTITSAIYNNNISTLTIFGKNLFDANLLIIDSKSGVIIESNIIKTSTSKIITSVNINSRSYNIVISNKNNNNGTIYNLTL